MSNLNIYAEISRLILTVEEKTFLRNYFTNNHEQKIEAVEVLSTCETDQEKIAFLKSFLGPGMYQYVKKLFTYSYYIILVYFMFIGRKIYKKLFFVHSIHLFIHPSGHITYILNLFH